MAQTTTSLGGVNSVVQVSADGTTWVDISGSTNQITATEQARASGDAYTFDGDVAIVKAGKREPTEITLRTIYTTTATEAWFKSKGYFETAGGAPTWLEWSPTGVLTGYTYRCEAAHITRLQYPAVDAADPNPIACEVSFRCPRIYECVGGVPIAEYADLATLYTTYGGADWTAHDNWLVANTLVSTWTGLTVVAGHVTALALGSNNFTTAAIATTWGANLPRLTTVDMSSNALNTVGMDALITAFYTNRQAFLNPANCDIGGTNDPPTGAVVAPAGAPPANPGEMAYEMINDSLGDGHKKWTTFAV